MHPQVCLGTAQFGLSYGVTNTSGQVNELEVRSLLYEASKAGLSLIDTAQSYGNAEAVLGCTMVPSANYRLISKLPKQQKSSFTAKDKHFWDQAFQNSLLRLGVSCLDAFLLHSPEDLLKPGGCYLEEWLLTLRENGLVKRLGLSIYDASDLEGVPQELLDLVQLPMSLYDQRLLHDGTITRLRSQGCAVHARSIYLQGLLLTPSEGWPDWADSAAKLHHARLEQFALDCHRTLLECVLGFVCAQQELEAAVVGVCSVSQLKELLLVWGKNSPWTQDEWRGWSMDNPTILDPRNWPR